MDNNAVYKPHEFAEMVRVTVKTLQRWDKSGLLKSHRTPSGRRFYTHEQYTEYMRRSDGGEITKE